jgi:uncharacterized delta-60 repeat protein
LQYVTWQIECIIKLYTQFKCGNGFSFGVEAKGAKVSKHLKAVSYKAVLLSMVVGLLGFTIVLAASGDLDTTFDGDGLVTTFVKPGDPGRYGRALDVAIQTDGKVIAAGDSYLPSATTSDFAVIRYNPNGSLDTAFSGDGRQFTDFGGKDSAVAVAVQSNGKIVVAGNKCINDLCDVALARYNPGGALDPTFSGNGKQTTDFGTGHNASDGGLAIQSNGKIVVAGYMSTGTSYDFAVYRYLPDGSLDTTFSGDGKVSIGFGAGRQDFATDLVIQSDGKIVVSGYTADAHFANNNFAVARLNKNGSLDPTFSGDGRLATNFGADDYAQGIALQTDGKIVLAGEKRTTSPFFSSFAVARYNTDGTPDTTFNGVGRKAFSVIAASNSSASDVIVQPDGKIVVLGAAFSGSLDYALVRLNSGGGFDTTFSGDGKILVDFFGEDFGSAVAIQPSDGSYVLSGYVDSFTQSVFGLARVLP